MFKLLLICKAARTQLFFYLSCKGLMLMSAGRAWELPENVVSFEAYLQQATAVVYQAMLDLDLY